MFSKALVAVLLSVITLMGAARAAETIVGTGATTVQPIVQAAGKEFKTAHPDVDFTFGGGGSNNGVESLASGKVQIGLVGRELKADEKEKNKDFVPVTIGYDGIGILVSNAQPIDKITKDQVHDIYTGKIKNWKDLGGKDAPINLTSRTEGHAQLELFANYFGLEVKFDAGKALYKNKGDADYAIKAAPKTNNNEMLAAVTTDENCLSYIPIGFALARIEKGAPLKLLPLDGTPATRENVGNGKYPLCRPLLVVTKGEPQGNVKAFISYLVSDAGQKIVSDQDYIPFKAKSSN